MRIIFTLESSCIFLLSNLTNDVPISTDSQDVFCSGVGEDSIPGLVPEETVLHDPPVSPSMWVLSSWFCFVQTEDGKVVATEYSKGDWPDAVNLKKGIAAAFQANFKGTPSEQEEDTMSRHTAAYRWEACGPGWHPLRPLSIPLAFLICSGIGELASTPWPTAPSTAV